MVNHRCRREHASTSRSYLGERCDTHTRGSFFSRLWFFSKQDALDDRMYRKMFIWGHKMKIYLGVCSPWNIFRVTMLHCHMNCHIVIHWIRQCEWYPDHRGYIFCTLGLSGESTATHRYHHGDGSSKAPDERVVHWQPTEVWVSVAFRVQSHRQTWRQTQTAASDNNSPLVTLTLCLWEYIYREQ